MNNKPKYLKKLCKNNLKKIINKSIKNYYYKNCEIFLKKA